MAGRLRHFRQNWEKITQDSWVLDTVSGYSIPFLHTPQQSSCPPSHTSEEERFFIDAEIQSLLQVGAIREYQSIPQGAFFSTLFTVPKKGGGRRPIINLKYLNSFLPHLHFKMEGLSTVRDIITRGDYMFKLDLKDAYFMFPVAEQHQKYLSFQWETKFFHFTCLPFGLSTAPWTFTKVTRPVVQFLRARGVRMVIYLDDMLFFHQQKEGLLEIRGLALDLLEDLGFLVNYEKSELSPVQNINFLGFMIDSLEMKISLPLEKVDSTVREAKKFLLTHQISARQLAHMIGIFSSTIPAILPAPLHYRELQSLKHQAIRSGGYSSTVTWSEEAKNDLEWWIANLGRMNGQPIH